MHIIVVIQRIEKRHHFLARIGADLGKILGHVTNFRRNHIPTGSLQRL